MAKNSNGKHVEMPFEVHNARFGGFLDPIATRALRQQLTTNLDRSFSRTWADQIMDPRRSIEDECGFPPLNKLIPIDTYQQLYERDPIAARVVEVLPKQTWQVNPQVYEDEASDVNTPFEQDWDDLGNELRGGEMNWFQDEEGSPIWGYMKRLDVLSGIGSYGVMLLGFDDVNTDWHLSNPVKMLKEEGSIPASKQEMAANYERALKDRTFRPYRLVRNAEVDSVFGGQDSDIEDTSASQFGAKKQPLGDSKKRVRLTSLRVLGEPLVQATSFESNPTSPRFGQPTMYNITLNDMRDQHGGTGMMASTYRVHWTRVIHYCDQDHQVSSSEIFAPPRMRASLNTLLGLRKIYHGDPEGYWKACVTIMSYETHPQLGGDVDIDIPSVRDMDEQLMNGLQRSVVLSGMSLKPVAPQVTDPTPHINVGIEAICIKVPVPVRVFKGSERGELASSQDDSQWNDTVGGRQRNTATPGIIVPFINRLIAVGALSRPTVGKKKPYKPTKPLPVLPPAQGGTGKPGTPPPKPAPFVQGKPTPATNADGEEIPGTVPAFGRQQAPQPPKDKPRGGYSVEWPDLDSLTDTEKATMGATKTTALAGYIAGGCSAMVPEHDYLTKYQGFTDEEADAMLEEAASLQEDRMAAQADQADEMGFDVAPPPGMIDPEQQDKEHKVAMEQAKHGPPAVPTPFGGGKAPPFGKKPNEKPAFNQQTDNSFCATGDGGGVDPSCSPSDKAASAANDVVSSMTDKQVKGYGKVYGIKLSKNIDEAKEQITQHLLGKSGTQTQSNIVPKEWHDKAVETVAQYQRENPQALMSLPDLHKKIGEGMTPEIFKSAVKELADKGRIRLHPWTRPEHYITDEKYAVTGESKYAGGDKYLYYAGVNNENVENWCNQYGGDTCKEGAGKEGNWKKVKTTTEKKEKAKKDVKAKREKRTPKEKTDHLQKIKEAVGGHEDKGKFDFSKALDELKSERSDKSSKDIKEKNSRGVFKKAWDFLTGNTEDDDLQNMLSAAVDAMEERLGRPLTDDEVDQLTDELVTDE